MLRMRLGGLVCAAVLLLVTGVVSPVPAHAAHPMFHTLTQKQAEKEKLTPRQAAARAKAQHGGRVLSVKQAGSGYKVRLLLDSGRVITVTIRG